MSSNDEESKHSAQSSDEKDGVTIMNKMKEKAQEQTLLELSQLSPLLPMHHVIDPSGALAYYKLLNSSVLHNPAASFLQQENSASLSNLFAGNMQLTSQQDIQQQIQHHSNLLARNFQLTQHSQQALQQKIQQQSNLLRANAQLTQEQDIQQQIQQQLMLHDPTLAMRLASAAYYGGVLPVDQFNASTQHTFTSLNGGENNQNELGLDSKSKASSLPIETQEQITITIPPPKKTSTSLTNASKEIPLNNHSPVAPCIKKSVHQPTVRGRPITVLQPQATHQPLQPGQALIPVQPSQTAMSSILATQEKDPQHSESSNLDEKLSAKKVTNSSHEKKGSLPTLLESPVLPETENIRMDEISPTRLMHMMQTDSPTPHCSIRACLPKEERLLDGEENWGEFQSLNDFKKRVKMIPQKMQEGHRVYLEHRSAIGTIKQAMGWTIPTAEQNSLYKAKASKEQIEKAIPDEASSTFFILDRRVNFDTFDNKVSCYSLLRSWVKDDPHRCIPPPGSNCLEYVTHTKPKQYAKEVINKAEETTCNEGRENESQLKNVDVFSVLKSQRLKLSNFERQDVPISFLLETNFLLGSRKRRIEQQKRYRLRQKAARRRLQSIGIVLKHS